MLFMLLVLGLAVLSGCGAHSSNLETATAAPTIAITITAAPAAINTPSATPNQPPESTPPPPATVTSEPAPTLTVPGPAASSCLGSTEKAIVDLDCREITIAVENAYPPFNYIRFSTGQPGGWDYDVWNALCTRLHCSPSFIQVPWDGMIQAVADGQYDTAADGITIMEERKQIVDFSTGYVTVDQRLLARAGETRFASMDDFIRNDKLVIGAQAGTINYQTVVKLLPESRIKPFEQFPSAVQALISGDIDAVIMDETDGQGYLGENPEKVELICPPISRDQLGFIFPKGSPLVEPVDKALQAMIADSSLDAINEKYFGESFKSIASDIKH